MKNTSLAMIALLAVISLTACGQTTREYPGQKHATVVAGKSNQPAVGAQGDSSVCIGEQCSCHSMNMD